MWTVAEAWLQHDTDEQIPAVIADALGLTVADLEAALAYWANYRDEIDELISRHHASQDEAQDVVGYDETYVFDGNNAMSLVGEVIRERGWADGTVGAELDAHSLRPSGLTALRSSLPGTRVVDGTGTVNWVRSIKTPAELDTMRAAGRVSDHAMTVAMQHVDVCVRDADVAAATLAALVEGVDDTYGSRPLLPIITGSARSNAPHLGWTGEPFRPGEPAASSSAGIDTITLPACRARSS